MSIEKVIETDLLLVPKEIPSKKQLPEVVTGVITDMVESGEYDVVDLYARLKWYKEAATVALTCDQLMSEVLDEIDKSNENAITKFGRMKIQGSSTGTKYDFTFDDRWNGMADDLLEAEKEVKRIKELMSKREIHLLAVADDPDIVFDGEGVEIAKVQVTVPSRRIIKATF